MLNGAEGVGLLAVSGYHHDFVSGYHHDFRERVHSEKGIKQRQSFCRVVGMGRET